MKARILFIISTFIGILHCIAQDADKFTLNNYDKNVTAIFQAWKCDNPKGVLVIMPGFGDNPSDIDTLEINEWKAQASLQHWGLVFIDITVSGLPILNESKSFNVIQGLSSCITKGIEQEYGSHVPIFLYSKNDSANQYVLSMIHANPESFAGWYCRACPFFASSPLLKSDTPPGIIASSTDSIYYDAARKFFSLGAGKQKWTWLSIRPIDAPKIRVFVRQYFQSLITPAPNQWRNFQTHQIIDADSLTNSSNPPEQLTWFPDAITGDNWSSIFVDRAVAPTIVTKEIDLSSYGLPNIQIYLRIPNGAQDASGVDGVLAFCTWIREKDNLLQQLTNDPEQSVDKLESPSVQMVRFAARHNLALITWSTPGTWVVGENADEVSEEDRRNMDKEFDRFSTAWDKGISDLCAKYKLPENQYLLFGMSRGAQWAHRLALRDPKRFLAVNAHVSSSYDAPTEDGKQCLWLITTGELDPGLESSKSFYQQCQKAGYSILLKAPTGLGHEMRSDVDTVRDAFFEYALSLKKQGQNAGTDMGSLISLQNAKFVGDYVTQKVVPVAQAEQIAPANRVYFPTEALAQAWATAPPPPPVLAGPNAASPPAASPITAGTPSTIESPAAATPVSETIKENLTPVDPSTNIIATPSPASPSIPNTQKSEVTAVSSTAPNQHQTATVKTGTKVAAITASGGHASVPLDPGAKLTIISINSDGTATVVTEFHFTGQVPQSCIDIDKP